MIVITGGAGFIGSNLVAGLEQAGYPELVVCDRFGDDERWRNIAKHEIADIITPKELMPFLDGHRNRLEAAIHRGAISETTGEFAPICSFSGTLHNWAFWALTSIHAPPPHPSRGMLGIHCLASLSAKRY
jgi:ADP-L-glycero-D-manno-heptose 6-epimerase